MKITGRSGRADSAGLLLAAFLGVGAASANAQIFGPMMGSFKQAFDWNRAEVSFGFTCVMLISPIVHVAMGLILDRYGSRRVALPGVIAFALGTALLGLAGPALWSWYALNLSYAVLAGGVGFAVWIKAVVERFDQHRGVALAVTLSGSGLIGAVMPTIVHWLLLHVALRAVYPAIALGLSVSIIVPAWLFLPTTAAKPRVSRDLAPASEWRLIVADSKVWRILTALLFVAGCSGIFIVHLQPILIDSGLKVAEAASVALFIGPALIAGRLSTGYLFDILPVRVVAITAFLFPGLACLFLLGIRLTYLTSIALAVLVGLGLGSELNVAAYLASRYFPLRHFGLVFGIFNSGFGLGLGGSAWLAGWVYDRTGSYDAVLIAFSLGTAISVLLVYSLGKPPLPRSADVGLLAAS